MHFTYRKKDGEVVTINRNRMEGGNIDSIGLKIHKVMRTDIGNYTCELQNDYGIGASENAIALDVHCEYCVRRIGKSVIREMCFTYSQRRRWVEPVAPVQPYVHCALICAKPFILFGVTS